MSITAGTALSLVKFLDYLEICLLVTGNDHLCNTLTIIDDEILLRQIDEHHAYLAAIVGINRTRGIQDGQTVLQGQSTAGTNLSFVTLRQCNEKTCRNQPTFHRTQHDRLVNIRTKIHTGALRRSILRQWLMAAVHNFNFYHFCCYHYYKAQR